MKKILLFFAVASCTALAQITINSSDVANMFAIGNTQQSTKILYNQISILVHLVAVIIGIFRTTI